jgi:hypothetical protein
MRYRGSRPVKGISHQLERLLHLVRMLLHLFDDLLDVSIMNDDPRMTTPAFGSWLMISSAILRYSASVIFIASSLLEPHVPKARHYVRRLAVPTCPRQLSRHDEDPAQFGTLRPHQMWADQIRDWQLGLGLAEPPNSTSISKSKQFPT